MNRSTIFIIILLSLFAQSCTLSPGRTGNKEKIEAIISKDETNIVPAADFNINADSIIKAHNIPLEKIRMEVSKTNYTFQLVYDTFIIKTYPCIFGLNPVDDKKMEGDRCTPEGTFKVIMKFPKHEWYKFIWFDYPNAESVKKFNERKARGEIPANALIGGKVGIHGVGNGDDTYDHHVDIRNNWTWGCINLKNKDLDEVFNIVQVGSKITIRH